MKKITALFVASTLALGAANLAHAADATATPTDNAPMMHHKRGPAGPHEMMFKGLNLTDAQKKPSIKRWRWLVWKPRTRFTTF